MSAPIEHADKVDEAMVYAPPWAREQSRSPSEAAFTPSPPMAPSPERQQRTERPPRTDRPRLPVGVGGPNIEWAPRLSPAKPFEGDVHMVALRRRLSLQPDIVPQPPPALARRRKATMPWVIRLALLFALSAVIAFGMTLLSSQYQQEGVRRADEEIVRALRPQTQLSQTPEDVEGEERARLIVQGRRAFANEPLPLQLALNGASGQEFVLLRNLTAGTRLSAGLPHGPSSWRVPATDLGSVFAHAPKDYIGAMDAGVDLRSGNRLVDRQVVRLEWIERPPVEFMGKPSQPDPWTPKPRAPDRTLDLSHDEISTLVKRGQQLMNIGDISSARLMLRRAAKAGNAQAALLLGATYDPFVLKDLGVIGFASDTAQARDWYRTAAALGSSEASNRIERLAQAAR